MASRPFAKVCLALTDLTQEKSNKVSWLNYRYIYISVGTDCVSFHDE